MGKNWKWIKRISIISIVVSIVIIILSVIAFNLLSDPVEEEEFGRGVGTISYTYRAKTSGDLYVNRGCPVEKIETGSDVTEFTFIVTVTDEDGKDISGQEGAILWFDNSFKIDKKGEYTITVVSPDNQYDIWADLLFVGDFSRTSLCLGCCIGPMVIITSIIFLIWSVVVKRKEKKKEIEREDRIRKGLEYSPMESRQWKSQLGQVEDLDEADDYYSQKWGNSYGSDVDRRT